ncbi:hypothetical protein BO71DRAFT_416792 [Aspergillus ellipticus CBS 707.79]|uniref:PXA domain-containing protein n=1 Tax=Aspergillus ellipticus CBS 707.79 TaxID=1448320 RepID=A0A319DJR6_9EURO|nr:hypothetical protein BO71DRAFT_416792 [Aspergillus ellipticus CBS 707.79]
MDEAPACVAEQVEASGRSYPKKEVLDFILHFLTNSSNEALLCALACLTGATVVIFGRLGLLLIGFVTGIMLHASWEGLDNHSGDSSERIRTSKRREVSLDIASRLLDWPERKSFKTYERNNGVEQGSVEEEPPADLDYSYLGLETAAALELITDAVMRDYVNYWSEPILPSETSFPLSCRKILTSFISSMSSHLSRKRAADTFLELLTNSSSMIIVLLNELSAVFQSVELPDSPEQIIIRYLEKFPESSLANILAKEQQAKKLNMVAGDILSSFLDSQVYNCPPLRDFLREILSSVLFESTISSLSRPDIINGWIIYLLSRGESEIMTAIDAGVEGAQKQGVTSAIASPNVNQPPSIMSGNTISDSKTSPGNAQQESADTDKATEEAALEAKRLSDMIAAHELQKQIPEKAAKDKARNDTSFDNDRKSSSADSTRDKTPLTKQSPTEVMSEGRIEYQCETELKEAPETTNSPLSSPKNPVSMNISPESMPSSSSISLYRASIMIETDSEVGGKGLLRSKPTLNYLLQIEPLSSRSTGWMVFRKYADFESLHETLEAISRLNKIQTFAEEHPIVPSWKGQTNSDLAKNLERYLQDALHLESLAESERMRRFFGKDEHLTSRSINAFGKTGFPFPSQTVLENVGKGVLGALTNAPKGVSGSGKAVLEGMSGVFGGGISQKSLPKSVLGDHAKVTGCSHQNVSMNHNLKRETESLARTGTISQSDDGPSSCKPLSPQPDDRFDIQLTETSFETNGLKKEVSIPESKVPIDLPYLEANESGPLHESGNEQALDAEPPKTKNKKSTITQEETCIAVELIFAVINELYTLSSAWNIRRTLLNAAKSYVLRPGNPNLETIRGLLQESIIDEHTSDMAIGMYLNKLRENAFPTETELKHWPSPPSDTEKKQLKETARKVFIEKGLPQALTSVMGASASKEALGKVFDCLQVEKIARGFVYTLLLQALKLSESGIRSNFIIIK